MTDKARFLVSRYVEAFSASGRLLFGDYETYRRPCSLEDAVFELRGCLEQSDLLTFSEEPSDPDELGGYVQAHVLVEGLDRNPLPNRTLVRLARLAGIRDGVTV